MIKPAVGRRLSGAGGVMKCRSRGWRSGLSISGNSLIALALIAAPLADRFAYLGTFAGLVVAIGIVFLYNGVRSWSLALGLTGLLPAWLAGWSPNLIFAALGLWLLLRHR